MRDEKEIKSCLEIWKKMDSKELRKDTFEDAVKVLIRTTIETLEWVLEG